MAPLEKNSIRRQFVCSQFCDKNELDFKQAIAIQLFLCPNKKSLFSFSKPSFPFVLKNISFLYKVSKTNLSLMSTV